jgi:hypothetical protein
MENRTRKQEVIEGWRKLGSDSRRIEVRLKLATNFSDFAISRFPY